MLIEFIGCSGAGKTTILNNIKVILAKRGFDAMSSTDIIKQATTTAWVRNDSLRNLLLNLFLLPLFIQSIKTRVNYFSFALQKITCYEWSILRRMSRIRSVMRQMGEDYLLRKKSSEHLVLVDEGMSGSVHNLLVYTNSYLKTEEIRQFVQMVPLPDLIIHIDTPLSTAMERTARRRDPPIRGESIINTKKFIKHARDVFNQLSTFEEFNGRFLSVINDHDTGIGIEAIANQVAGFILEKLATNSCSGHASSLDEV